MINRNLTETSEELISLFLHCPEVTELDLSNNLLSFNYFFYYHN